MNQDRIRVVVTGISWMGSGIGSVESALKDLVSNTQEDLGLTVYSITLGADSVLSWIETLLGKGVRVRMLVNSITEQDAAARARLDQLNKAYNHFHLFNFITAKNALHAKLVVADGRRALVGSSNLSWSGLVSNHELAVLLEGPSAEIISDAFSKLLSSHTVELVKPVP